MVQDGPCGQQGSPAMTSPCMQGGYANKPVLAGSVGDVVADDVGRRRSLPARAGEFLMTIHGRRRGRAKEAITVRG